MQGDMAPAFVVQAVLEDNKPFIRGLDELGVAQVSKINLLMHCI